MLRKRKSRIIAVTFAVALVIYYFCLPQQLFKSNYSTVINDNSGQLLCASIAADGQWRFPLIEEIPRKFKIALIEFEDKRFYSHPGVDLLALSRATVQNLKAGKVVSGGSTISMQVIRLSRKEQSRTFMEKTIESILATRLELRYSKKEILQLYASHAPFGGNVVGLEAACWRYFGRSPDHLSWAEASMLAVLPNAPALIHPGKNRAALKEKRDHLLDQLREKGIIDDFTCELAKSEPIPEKPYALPRNARHLMTKAIRDGFTNQKLSTTIRGDLQVKVEEILQRHHELLGANQINNACAIVVDVESGNVFAYVGNVDDPKNAHNNDVDIITAPRSTGSVLKPFLFAAMLDDGKILQHSLLTDVPTSINGFAPQNFSKQYDGAVPADKALVRSLNVPAVQMLQSYRYERFYQLLKNMGMSTLNRPADHYGLALILGGAEGSLWDITGIYASMARSLNHYFDYAGSIRYDQNDYHPLRYIAADETSTKKLAEVSWLSAPAIYQTFDALKEMYRPGEESGWRNFSSSQTIAWKTGTSYGFRDAWAVGVTGKLAVGVWVGNADGEGRPGLTGAETAAPVMFDIFDALEPGSWFKQPKQEMTEISICSRSGYRAGDFCSRQENQWVQLSGLQMPACPYHTVVHLSADKRFRVNSECEKLSNMVNENWFVLPPVQEYYYKSKNLSYVTLPPVHPNCQSAFGVPAMELVYPRSNTRIYIPKELDGTSGVSVFELAHRFPARTVYWHLDGEYLGSTSRVHQMAVNAKTGEHRITLVDEAGEVLEKDFEILSAL